MQRAELAQQIDIPKVFATIKRHNGKLTMEHLYKLFGDRIAVRHAVTKLTIKGLIVRRRAFDETPSVVYTYHARV